MLLLKLFFAFIQVGLFSVGGGYAAIPLIQEQIVNIYGLMTLEEFSAASSPPSASALPWLTSITNTAR